MKEVWIKIKNDKEIPDGNLYVKLSNGKILDAHKNSDNWIVYDYPKQVTFEDIQCKIIAYKHK